MLNESIIKLINKLMVKRVSPKEFSELKAFVEEATTDQLEGHLQNAWENCEDDQSMDAASKYGVLASITNTVLSGRIKFMRRWIRVAAVLVLGLMAASSYFLYQYKQFAEPQYFVVRTAPGQKNEVLLPDSTLVLLNSDSRLTYSSHFNKTDRKVILEGEGFFKVSKQANAKFSVIAGNIGVIAYGTEFNVMAYADDENVQVALLEGQVAVRDVEKNKDLIFLKPDQIVTLGRSMSVLLEDGDASLASLWTKDKLRFENEPYDLMYRKLERWYGFRIHVVNAPAQLTYGFTIKGETLAQTLEVVNKITPITYRIRGEEVEINYK